MREYEIINWLSIPKAPGVPRLEPGPIGYRARNVLKLKENRWLSLLKMLEDDIKQQRVQVASETRFTLRMDPERQIELKNQYGIVLEEYVSERRLDVSPEVPPAQEEPPAQKRDRRRILWHFK